MLLYSIGLKTADNRRVVMNKMLLISTIFGVFVISVSSGLKNCDDCKSITECKPALNLVINDKSPQTAALVRKAHCGFDRHPKVCCSDFLLSRSAIGDENNDNNFNNEVSGAEEIENHPNIYLLSGECGDLEGNRIIGGSATSLYEFPWLALISYKVGNKVNFNCGGTVINPRYVLTAAHCVKNKQIAGVRIGDYDISKKTDCTGDDENRDCESYYQDIAVVQTFYNHGYARIPRVVNDIGLLRLARPVDMSYRNAGTICLPITKLLRDMDITSERGIVAGWGVTETQQRSNVLLKVEVPIYSALTCSALYNRNNLSKKKKLINVICAGELGHDSCKGDSGGPLMVEAPYNETYKLIQYGIVSYGPSQCGSTYPGVYTDVRKYMKWILDTIQP